MDIRLKNLSKRFGKRIILENVTLNLPSGKILGLVGPNGVGKTTFMRILMNIDKRYQGQVFFGDRSNRDYRVFETLSFMHDNRILYPDLTAYDHLKFLADIHHLDYRRIDEMADYVGISSYLYQKAGTYSLGMKQHLLIAMALINQPSYIVMDEPFNGLDPTRVIAFKEIFKEVNRAGMTIILSSHNLALVQDLTDIVYFLKDGQLLGIEMDQQSSFHYLVEVSDLEALIPIFQSRQEDYHLEGDRFSVRDLTAFIQVCQLAQVEILKVDTLYRTLEDLYQDTYSQAEDQATGQLES